jgi:hypothetical protein
VQSPCQEPPVFSFSACFAMVPIRSSAS